MAAVLVALDPDTCWSLPISACRRANMSAQNAQRSAVTQVTAVHGAGKIRFAA